MTFFSKLLIENFQSHEQTEICFSPHLNVLVGPSDSGKSAILRALRWVLFNTPRGNDFVQTGKKQCKVSLTLSNGTEIVRMRGTSVNRYILRVPEEEEQVFEGFGNTIPQEIVDAYQIRPITLDQRDIVIHYGSQLESPFLLFESPGNKAKIVGRVSGAHLIDVALKNAGVDRHAVLQETRYLAQQEEHWLERLAPYQELDQVETKLISAEVAFHKAEQQTERMRVLAECDETFGQVKFKQERCKEQMYGLKSVLSIEERLILLEAKKARLNQLVNQRRRLIQVRAELQANRHQKKLAQQCLQVESNVVNLLAQRERWLRLTQLHREWLRITRLIRETAKYIYPEAKLVAVEKNMERVSNHKEQYVLLLRLDKQYEDYRYRRRYVQQMLNTKVAVTSVEGTLLRVHFLDDQRTKLLKISQEYHELILRLSVGKEYCRTKQEDIDALQAQWTNLFAQLKQCPTCGADIRSPHAQAAAR